MRVLPIITAILVAAALFFFVFQRDTLTGASSEPETDKVADGPTAAALPDGTVAVVAVKSLAKQLDKAVLVRGQTEATRQVHVQAETSGQMVSTPLRKGTFVETGDLLCELDPGTREASLAEARARQSEATARRAEAESRVPEARARVIESLARVDEALVNQNAATKLSEDGFASETRVKNADAAVATAQAGVEAANAGVSAAQSGIQAADASIESAEASVAAAMKEISRLRITAPFAGVLESDTAELGSLLQPGALCATVIQLDPIKLVGFVPELDVDHIELGARAGARLTSGEDVVGNVTFVSRSADSKTRTFLIEVEVPNPDLRIRDGQTVEIIIASDGADAHLLPGSAMTLNDLGVLGVRVVKDGKVAFKPVALLRDTTQGVWLTGLDAEEDVIVVGQEYVTDGVPVAVTYRDDSQ